MSNLNKLAFKGTPGPWKHDTGKSGGPCVLNNKNKLIFILGFGIVNVEEDTANAHLISAAPEAVEFIADLLHSLSSDIPNMDIPKIIARGENILKKAYNF